MKKFLGSAVLVMTLMISCIFGGVSFRSVDASAAGSAVWPLDSSYQNITCYFDPNRNTGGYGHNAIDIEANGGANIYAVRSGVCVSAEWMGDYGYMVILRHDDIGMYTFYAHCSSMSVSAGQSVSAGTVIGGVGATGTASGNHLHYGICDNLLGGYPNSTYYDPLTYFVYDGDVSVDIPDVPTESCDCSEEYAGTYTTEGVTTYLNIRSGHGSGYSVVGTIKPGEEFTVTKANSQWAHVVCNGVSGYCSMDYIKKISDPESSMSVSGETKPSGWLKPGASFSVKGKVTSALPIKSIKAGIYKIDGSPCYESSAAPKTNTFDLNGFDQAMLFNKLNEGSYYYLVEAEDSSGKTYTLIDAPFKVGTEPKAGSGDLNGDGKTSVADAVVLQGYLLGDVKITAEQASAADMNGDSSVDVFDMVCMRKAITK